MSKAQIVKWGNSLAVRIPKPIAEVAGVEAGDAGSRRISFGWWSAVRWCAGLTPALERLGDDHVSTTTWTQRIDIGQLFRRVLSGDSATASSSRARVSLALRAEAESRP